MRMYGSRFVDTLEPICFLRCHLCKDGFRWVPNCDLGAYSGTMVAPKANFLFRTGAFDGDGKMTTASDLSCGPDGQTPESLLTLVEYLELSLDQGKCVVMMRHGTDVCSVYFGDPAGEEADLTVHGTIAAAVADEILEFTQAGTNQITVGDQTYRFFRSFTHIADVGAVIFAPA
jgi:hypothetical protein